MSFKSFRRLVFSPPYEDGNKYSTSPFFLLAVQRNICVLDDFIGSETIIRAFCLVWSFILVSVASSNFYDLVYILKSHVVWPRLLKRQRGIGVGTGGVWGILVHARGPWAQPGEQGMCSVVRQGVGRCQAALLTACVLPGWGAEGSRLSQGHGL